MSERVSVREAADILGMSVQNLRDKMADGTIPIGTVVIGKTNQYGSRKNTYLIYRPKLERFIGKDSK